MSAPIASETRPPLATITRKAGIPPRMVAPNGHSTRRKNAAWNAPKSALPARRASTIPDRVDGARSSRSKNLFSMSVASAAAPDIDPKSTPWMTVAASENWRNESTSGNPGKFVVLPNDDAPRAAKKIGKIMLGALIAGWRTISSVERLVICNVCRMDSPRLCSARTAVTIVRLQDDGQWLRRRRRPGSVR